MALPTDRVPHSFDVAVAHLQRAKAVVEAAKPHPRYPNGHYHLAKYIQWAMDAIRPWCGPDGLTREQVESDLKQATKKFDGYSHDCGVLMPLLPWKDKERVKTLLIKASKEVHDPYDLYPKETPNHDPS